MDFILSEHATHGSSHVLDRTSYWPLFAEFVRGTSLG